ncbi:MAG: recombinase family protein, partial [Syntrophorhabdus sp.]
NNLDTSTPTGKLVFHVIGAVAEFEKDIIKERVKAGLENAKRKGKKLGRPGIGDSVIEEAKALRGEGKSFRTIGKELRISEGVVRRRLKG